MVSAVFHEIALLLAAAAAAGVLAVRFRQPLIIAYVLVGILVGSVAMVGGAPTEEISLLAMIGVALLLFVVGLKLDLHMIRVMGFSAVTIGLVQIALTAILGGLFAVATGLAPLPAFYVAMAVAFSSTVVAVKLLSDKREIDSLHGRMAVGVLIVQDLVVVVTMVAVSTIDGAGDPSNRAREIGLIILKAAVLIGGVILLMRFALPGLLHSLAHSQELLLLFAIAWAVVVAALADFLNLSAEVGAFLAGVSLASTPYREMIGARLTGLRDFLLLFFFIQLGMSLDMQLLRGLIVPALALSLLVLVVKPLIILTAMGIMGYRKRPAFLSGAVLSQVSEFSFILVGLGLQLGHVDPGVTGLVLLVGVITIGLSTYFFMYASRIYRRIGHLIPFPARNHEARLGPAHPEEAEVEVILFGLGRYGRRIGEGLRRRGHVVLGVDFDPEAVKAWRDRGVPVRYGDAEDPEFLTHLPLDAASWVVSTAPSLDANLALLHGLHDEGFEGNVAVRAQRSWEENVLESAGADLVLHPYVDAAVQAIDRIAEGATPSLPEGGFTPRPSAVVRVKRRTGMGRPEG